MSLADAAAHRMRQIREWWAAALLGWAAIGAYGVGLYAFGVLIEPIHRDTLWSRGALSAAFSIGAFGAAAGSAVAGRALDRFGGAPVLGSAVLLGTVLLFVAASAAAVLLRPRIGERFKAIVTGASEKGTWVRISAPTAEGRVVQGFAGLDVGDKLEVELVATDVARGHIDFRRAR